MSDVAAVKRKKLVFRIKLLISALIHQYAVGKVKLEY